MYEEKGAPREDGREGINDQREIKNRLLGNRGESPAVMGSETKEAGGRLMRDNPSRDSRENADTVQLSNNEQLEQMITRLEEGWGAE